MSHTRGHPSEGRGRQTPYPRSRTSCSRSRERWIPPSLSPSSSGPGWVHGRRGGRSSQRFTATWHALASSTRRDADPGFSNLLDEFFDELVKGKEKGLGEEATRGVLADRHGLSKEEVVGALVELAIQEKAKGQKGLTKFIAKWRKECETAESLPFPGESSAPSREWSVVSQGTPPKGEWVEESQVVERAGPGPLLIAPRPSTGVLLGIGRRALVPQLATLCQSWPRRSKIRPPRSPLWSGLNRKVPSTRRGP